MKYFLVSQSSSSSSSSSSARPTGVGLGGSSVSTGRLPASMVAADEGRFYEVTFMRKVPGSIPACCISISNGRPLGMYSPTPRTAVETF